MSLINEALKRAKQAHARQASPAAAGPPLEPAAEAASSQLPSTRILAGAAALILLASAWCLTLWWRSAHRPPAAVASAVHAARSAAPARPAAASPVQTAPAAVKERPASKPETHALALVGSASVASASVPTVNGETNQGAASTATESGSASARAAASTKPAAAVDHAAEMEPAPAELAADAAILNSLKVQGIFYRTSKASAMINGQAFFLGDEVQGAKLVEIERTSVALLLHGRTNILYLK